MPRPSPRLPCPLSTPALPQAEGDAQAEVGGQWLAGGPEVVHHGCTALALPSPHASTETLYGHCADLIRTKGDEQLTVDELSGHVAGGWVVGDVIIDLEAGSWELEVDLEDASLQELSRESDAPDSEGTIGSVLAKQAVQASPGKTSTEHGEVAGTNGPSDGTSSKEGQAKKKTRKKKKRSFKAAATTAVATDRLNREALLGFAREFLHDEHRRRESKTKWGKRRTA